MNAPTERPEPAELADDPSITGRTISSNPILAFTRLMSYLALTGVMAPMQATALVLRIPLSKTLPRIYHRICCRILGFKIVIRGRRIKKGPVLFVSNHVSYLDISVLAAVVTGSFIAKAEVADWPFYGVLAKLQRTVFVRRERNHVGKQADEIGDRLAQGDRLILFPEGTSGDGNRVLPFKSALFAVADRDVNGAPLTVQPVSIAYTRLNGMPMGRAIRPFFAWYGDMSLAPHLWTMLGLGRATVEVRFHPPITFQELGGRKALAAHCEKEVAAGVSAALKGKRALV
ncbi:MAG: 1-acyl-sn-glycerol-3-phosphate acyltransferase [Alphaproteobacteria bacterium]|nr:1-acyl-sn-glycerol-3-phosphate acyltransferase [Alphaproteobacteria bacterium]